MNVLFKQIDEQLIVLQKNLLFLSIFKNLLSIVVHVLGSNKYLFALDFCPNGRKK